jgi:carnitine-CoA ligase
VIISPNYTPREVKFFLNHSEAGTILTSEKLLDTIWKIKEDCPSLKNIICIEDTSVPETLSLPGLMKESSSLAPPTEINGDDIAGIQYTSGTSSGVPKGVLYSNQSFGFSAKEWCKACQVTADSRIITVSQFVHANGVLAMLMSLLSGASFAFPEEFHASRFWGLVDRWKPTHFVTVAAFLAILLTLEKSKEEEENSLNVIFSVAASSRYKEITERFNVELLDCFAMSETAGTMTPIPIDRKYKVGSAGFPHAGVDLRIFDENDEEVPAGVPGEIVIKNPTMFKGYYKNPEATEEAMRGGWFHTGDLAYLDEDGCLWFVDRKKDIVRRGGENISSREVEEVLNSHPDIFESALIGIPDKVLGEEVKAFVIPTPGKTPPKPEEIIEYCRERLAKFKLPRFIEFRDSFPKTPSGKIKKVILKEEPANQTDKSS